VTRAKSFFKGRSRKSAILDFTLNRDDAVQAPAIEIHGLAYHMDSFHHCYLEEFTIPAGFSFFQSISQCQNYPK
jgi:hypothetical protein